MRILNSYKFVIDENILMSLKIQKINIFMLVLLKLSNYFEYIFHLTHQTNIDLKISIQKSISSTMAILKIFLFNYFLDFIN